jgi:myo-inositol 2-dehydrogenase / D-chiro-inositol 1-dehydrogenase
MFAARPAGIVVSTPTAAHASLVELCIEMRIPCLCEKPLSLDLDSTMRIRGLAADRDAYVQVGFHRRFDAECRQLRAAIASGRLGTVRRLHLITADREPPPAEFLLGSGGMFRDLLIHDFDLVRWLTGSEVSSVFATGSADGDPIFARADDVHTAACVLTLACGAVATVHGGRDNGAGHDVRVEVAGTTASVSAGLGERTPLVPATAGAARPGAAWSGFLDRFADAYARELDAFVEGSWQRTPPQCGIEDSYQALAIALAADRSRQIGRPVSLAPAGSGLAYRLDGEP